MWIGEGAACLSPKPCATMTVEVCRLSAGTTSAAAEPDILAQCLYVDVYMSMT